MPLQNHMHLMIKGLCLDTFDGDDHKNRDTIKLSINVHIVPGYLLLPQAAIWMAVFLISSLSFG